MRQETVVGRVIKAVHQKGYGFALTDSGKQYFFHIENMKGARKLPQVGTLLRFVPVAQGIEGKSDRAVQVEELG